ncbi:hypothetical protein CPC16_007965 [Podila verticillata]|uniref:Uncharacterized protein n=1 Tax=Podila verticillata NRRL 6337 TaxID=1069443 RepID=A0A086TMB9_9FUNG|nr:hypothetical protein BGZ52_005866 [Haplosporangium bisporale]KAF9215209.1 hypothetical protein BGZ59_002020 [Podila verticillata]KAF9385477.1 hypothetical protein CPC16_007965 [Podila verticillata]KAI9235220.1 MAG: hypothetical protein BYD32DRAFT_463652 [Podila humilis]KFH63096.1 hypothetical protein MVEG_11133 [Podila verticillata NRRL 6337]
MKFATAIVAAAVAAIANAQTAWNFPPEGACVAACTNTVGKAAFPMYDDVNSEGPFFLVSLSYYFNVGTPQSDVRNTQRTICMLGCLDAEVEAYHKSTPVKFAWYVNNVTGDIRPPGERN